MADLTVPNGTSLHPAALSEVVGFLNHDEIVAILLAVDRSTWIERRDYALLLTMLRGFARCHNDGTT